MTFGRALLVDRLGRDRLGRSIGYSATAMTAGFLLGPAIGGALYQFSGYLSIYYLPIALLILEAFLRIVMIEKRASDSPRKPDEAPQKDDQVERPAANGRRKSVDSGSSDESSVVGNGHRHRGSEDAIENGDTEADPLLKKPAKPKFAYFTFFKSLKFSLLSLSCLILNSLTNGFDAILPTYAHDSFDFSPGKVSALFLILLAPTILAPVSGWICDKYGTKGPLIFSSVVLTPSILLLAFVVPTTSMPFLKFAILFALIGVATSQSFPALQVEMINAVGEIEDSSPGIFGPSGASTQAYGIIGTVASVGSLGECSYLLQLRNAPAFLNHEFSVVLISPRNVLPELTVSM